MTSVPETLTFYTRRQCHLCDDARAALAGSGYVIREIDIASDPGLEAEFGTMVPVIEIEGEVIFSAGMSASELPELLADFHSTPKHRGVVKKLRKLRG